MYPASLTLIAGFIVAPVLIFQASLVERPWGPARCGARHRRDHAGGLVDALTEPPE